MSENPEPVNSIKDATCSKEPVAISSSLYKDGDCLRCIKSVKQDMFSFTSGKLYVVVNNSNHPEGDPDQVRVWRDDYGFRTILVPNKYFEKFTPRVKKGDYLVCVHSSLNLLTVGVIYQAERDSYYNGVAGAASEHVRIVQDDRLRDANAFDLFHFDKVSSLADENDLSIYYPEHELYKYGINEL